jgi:transcriptional regulator with XRE-family HTH domain
MEVNNLKKLRELSGLTQNKLSKLSGIAQSTIWRIENQEQQMTEEVIRKLAQTLKVSTDILLNFRLAEEKTIK